MTATLSLITSSFSCLLFFFFFNVLFFSPQTPEFSILKTDCFIDYVPFEFGIVIGAFLKTENFPKQKKPLTFTRLELGLKISF